MLKTRSVNFSYNNAQSFHFPDITVGDGAHILILGNSGKGKTTYLHLLAGLLVPTSGEIMVKGTSLSNLKGQALDRFRGQHIGIIFQQSHFVKSLNVEKNLLLSQYLASVSQDKVRITYLLDRLGLANKGKQKPNTLSAGERQRVAIARAMLNRPEIILADEPTSSLDDENTYHVIQLLREQAKEVQASLIIVTHDHRLKDEFENRIEL